MLSIRAATAGDASAISRIDVETWRTTYAGMLPDRVLLRLDARQRARQWAQFIMNRPGDTIAALDEAGAVLGFGSCGPQRECDLPYGGEVFTLYVEPDHQGQGVGRQLLMALFQRLIRCGFYSGLLWVLAGNPSRFFYERVGGHLIGARKLPVGPAQVDAVAYAWPDLADAVRCRLRTVGRTEPERD
jgi:GNAT superfamily N-acetyltransferase